MRDFDRYQDLHRSMNEAASRAAESVDEFVHGLAEIDSMIEELYSPQPKVEKKRGRPRKAVVDRGAVLSHLAEAREHLAAYLAEG